MFSTSAPTDPLGISVLADAARSAVLQLGGGAEIAALIVRLLADDAHARSTVEEAPGSLQLFIEPHGTEIILRLHDFGEPVSGPPSVVLSLVDIGLATGATGGTDGAGNTSVVRIPAIGHHELVDHTELEVLAHDSPEIDAPVTIRPIEAADAEALTRCIYRCYGWTYPLADLYFHERVAAAITSGKRLGEIAVDEHGEVVAHWGAVFVTEGVVETGGTVTDPRFRRRGLADQLGERLLARIESAGAHGRLREPVLTHPATQKIALREGATVVGILLNASEPIQQVGITDGVQSHRPSLSQMYSPLRPLEPATIYVPSAYEPIVRHVVDNSSWPREFGRARAVADQRPTSAVSSSYDSSRHCGSVTVDAIGLDLIEAVDETLEQLRRAGAEVVNVFLPANDPALASIGAGLDDLALGYCSFVPAYGELGDALTLQWLRDPEIDISDWTFADERVENLARLVVDQAHEVGSRRIRERRRVAQRQSRFAALIDD
jgi:GNAT superfamily N-acetyltransferase